MTLNPLKAVPNTLGSLDAMGIIAFEYTNVTSPPAYLQDWFLKCLAEKKRAGVSYYGSPFCELNQRSDNPQVDINSPYFTFSCGRDRNTSTGFYQLFLIQPNGIP